jgi:hypothetical protein
MPKALEDGETHPAVLGAVAGKKLRAPPLLLCAALGAGRELNAAYRRLLKMTLEELRLLERQSGQLDEERAPAVSQRSRRHRTNKMNCEPRLSGRIDESVTGIIDGFSTLDAAYPNAEESLKA